MKKLFALLLAVAMIASVMAGCNPANDNPSTGSTNPSGTTPSGGDDIVVEKFEGDFTYTDSVGVLSANWNPHTYQTENESYPISFLTTGLYGFFFNDELKPVDGKDPYAGYVIIPEMAASEPVDVTTKIKAEHPEFNIPESAEKGYAYTIDLNPNATWSDGTPINADTYVKSMQLLLDPKLMNYRASDYYAGQFSIAGAEYYANQGTSSYIDDATLVVADLVKNEDGTYSDANGNPVFVNVSGPSTYFGGDALADYVGAYGDAYFSLTYWDQLVAAANEDGYAPLTDDTLAWITDVVTGNPAWGEDESYIPNYIVYHFAYPETYDFANVGLYKSGDYQITLVLNKSLSGFYLLYNLSGNWIVKPDLYESCLQEKDGVWTNTYNTSLETCASYGPYVMTEYQTDKNMRFERNENWFGYTDGKHIYKDPVDGKYYPMYQTTAIDTQVVVEAATNKLMFLAGELMTYGLQADDFATYRNSEYVHVTPAPTIFFLILNGHKDAIAQREAMETFDKNTTDLETMTLDSFRRAVAVTYDKELFCSTISPARSGGYGIIGSTYIYDPDTGAKYRDTDQAKQVLCDFYSVDVSKYASLDEAVASITGYDPVKAKELFTQAFSEALDAGYITDSNNDGVSDQTVTITYSLSEDSDFMTQTIDYLNEKMNEVTKGTPFEGKVLFIKSAPQGDPGWSDNLKAGMTDTVLGGWNGSEMDPFGLTDLYTNPAYQYDAAWFDASTVTLSLTVPVDGKDTELTMSLKQWSDALNGTTVTVSGTEYNFGADQAEVDTRLNILAAIEGEVLKTYNYIPMMQNAGMTLLTMKAFYVIDEYNPVMGRGGIAYLKYNYNDTEWAAFVAEQGGELQY